MNEEQRRQIVGEVAALTRPPNLAAEEFTRSDYVRETGMGMSGATLELTRLVQQGTLAVREVYDPRTRRRAWAYRFVREQADE